jgi:hypothetical protein
MIICSIIVKATYVICALGFKYFYIVPCFCTKCLFCSQMYNFVHECLLNNYTQLNVLTGNPQICSLCSQTASLLGSSVNLLYTIINMRNKQQSIKKYLFGFAKEKKKDQLILT